MNSSMDRGLNLLLSSLLAASILSFFCAPLKLFGYLLVGEESWRLFLIIGLIAALVIRIPGFVAGKSLTLFELRHEPFIAALLLLVFSDFSSRHYVYFARPFSLSIFALIFVCGLAGSKFFTKLREANPGIICVLFIVFMFTAAINAFGGRLIFSDDHPSFFYRLSLLKEEFPFIPFYNPQWNGGFPARDFFATGALGVFLLFFPFLKLGLLNRPENYSLIVATLATILPVLSTFLACRVLKLGTTAALIGMLLAVAPSLDFFEWLLQYGTLGFICSASLLPLVFSLSYRMLLGEDRLAFRGTVFLLVAATLCFFWTLSVVVFLPLAVVSIFYLPTLIRERRIKKISLFMAAFLILNGPWLVTFIRESQVTQFVSKSHLPGSPSQEAKPFFPKFDSVHKKLRELETKVHPGILLLIIPAIAFIRERKLKFVLSLTTIWLIFLASVGEHFKPQLELRRANLLCAYLILPFIASFLSSIINSLLSTEREERKVLHRVGAAILLGSILLAPLNAIAAYSNRADIQFRYASDAVFELVNLVKGRNSKGRVFFLGFILHEFGQSAWNTQDGGHIAPLPLWTGKEMVASHFFHARWSSVDPIPPAFLKRKREGVEEFLDLMNADLVAAFRKEWIDYCEGDSRYKLIGKAGRFWLFSRESINLGPLLEGDAEILSVGLDKLEVRPKTEKLLLKYRYLPGLKTDKPEGAQLRGRFVFDEEVARGQHVPYEMVELEVKKSLLEKGDTVTIGYYPK